MKQNAIPITHQFVQFIPIEFLYFVKNPVQVLFSYVPMVVLCGTM